MARRDMLKTAGTVKGTVDPNYDLRQSDIENLYMMAVSGLCCEAIAAAFRYGYVMGHRATIKGTYKENGKEKK